MVIKLYKRSFLIFFFIAEADDLEHARKLVEILTDTESQDIKDVKLSVSIYCKTFYKKVQ